MPAGVFGARVAPQHTMCAGAGVAGTSGGPMRRLPSSRSPPAVQPRQGRRRYVREPVLCSGNRCILGVNGSNAQTIYHVMPQKCQRIFLVPRSERSLRQRRRGELLGESRGFKNYSLR